MSLPFKPPVYRTYFECFQGLYKQGVFGFYKGNGVRCMHIFMFHKLNSEFNFLSEELFPNYIKTIKQIPCAKEFLLTCSIDMLLHPLHLAESRFIMQNRFPNFSIYGSLFSLFKRQYSEIFRGILMHIPRNFFIALSK